MFKYKSNSREHQDFFILSMLEQKQNGTYVEIGGATPIVDNNTYLLESEFNWRGFSIEWNKNLADNWKLYRKNPCICADATTLDYTALFEQYKLDFHIDYLQLDIDPYHVTFVVLNKIDFTKYSFSVITYEHDLWQGGDVERIESRKIIENYGYVRVMSDVMNVNRKFEDWYVHPNYVPKNIWEEFAGDSINMNPGSLPVKYMELFNRLS